MGKATEVIIYYGLIEGFPRCSTNFTKLPGSHLWRSLLSLKARRVLRISVRFIRPIVFWAFFRTTFLYFTCAKFYLLIFYFSSFWTWSYTLTFPYIEYVWPFFNVMYQRVKASLPSTSKSVLLLFSPVLHFI